MVQHRMQGLLDLFAFVRVVEAGSFAEAGRRAGTTASALSKAVTRAERAYGVRLLHRTTHALSPTAEGERLLAAARDVMEEAEKLDASLAELRCGEVAGRVRVSAPGAFARACLLPLLPGLLQTHPALDIEISFDDRLIDFGSQSFDFAVRSGHLNGPPGMIARQLTTYPMILCAAPRYLMHRGTPRCIAELADHDLIGFRNSATGTLLAWSLARADAEIARITPRFRMIVDDGTAGWSMVRDGLGIAWAPAWLGYADLQSGCVVEIMRESRIEEIPISAVGLQRSLTPRRSQVVLAAIAAAAPTWTATQK